MPTTPTPTALLRGRRLAASVAVALGLSLSALPAGADDNPFASAAELGLMQGFPPPPDKRVTRGNALLTPPFNRWSYQHMRMIYPSAPVAAAETAVALAKAIDPAIDGLRIEHPGTGGTVDMAGYLTETYADAIVVIKDDRIVYEKYLNGMHPDQPHQMMSVTKSFAGLLGLMAVEAGKLAESDQITKYVPELKGAGGFAGASFGQVLDMTNSMAFTEDYADPESGVRRYGATLGWTDPLPGVEYEDSLYDYLATLDIDPEHPHGDIFHYQTPKTDVVNWVTNRVNDQSFQDTMHEQLWSKLGTEGETYVLLDRNATVVAGGGLNATPYNLARFATMMINGGRFDGRQVVPAAVIEALATGGNIAAFDKGSESDGVVHPKGEWSYRAQWWVKHTAGMEAFMAIGIHGQWIYLDVDRRIAIVKQSSQPVSEGEVINGFDLNGFYAIVRHLSG